MLFVRKGEQKKFNFNSAEELVKILESGTYKLGVIDGFFYGATLMQYINDPRYANRIIKAKDDLANFTNLLEHRMAAWVAKSGSGNAKPSVRRLNSCVV